MGEVWVAAGAAVVGAGASAYSASKAGKGLSGTSSQSRPAYLENASEDAINRGQRIADRNYEGYDGRNRVAGLSGNEQLAYDTAASLPGKYQGLMDRAGKEYNSGNLQQYMDPYRDNVIDIQARRINEDFDKRKSGLDAKRGMMDAFGTDRGTMLETELGKQRSQALRDSEYTGLSNAFTSGTNSFFNDRNSTLGLIGTGMNADTQAIGALQGTGANERATRQGLADFDYGQFLEQRDWDVTNLDTLLQSINTASAGSGSTTKTTSQTPGGSNAAALAGLASTVAGAWMTNGSGGGGGGSIVQPYGGIQGMNTLGSDFGAGMTYQQPSTGGLAGLSLSNL